MDKAMHTSVMTIPISFEQSHLEGTHADSTGPSTALPAKTMLPLLSLSLLLRHTEFNDEEPVADGAIVIEVLPWHQYVSLNFRIAAKIAVSVGISRMQLHDAVS